MHEPDPEDDGSLFQFSINQILNGLTKRSSSQELAYVYTIDNRVPVKVEIVACIKVMDFKNYKMRYVLCDGTATIDVYNHEESYLVSKFGYSIRLICVHL